MTVAKPTHDEIIRELTKEVAILHDRVDTLLLPRDSLAFVVTPEAGLSQGIASYPRHPFLAVAWQRVSDRAACRGKSTSFEGNESLLRHTLTPCPVCRSLIFSARG